MSRSASAEVLVTGGTGPEECRWFASALADAIGARFGTLWRVGDALGLDVEPSELAGWIGTHELVWRTRPGRKRWFVGVALFPPAAEVPVLDPADVVLAACRSGGPGGQAVNTTSSAVLARHVPTGIAVRVEDERSQHQNRRLALLRLAEALGARARMERMARDRDRWLAHHRVQRGSPVRRWRREDDGLVEV